MAPDFTLELDRLRFEGEAHLVATSCAGRADAALCRRAVPADAPLTDGTTYCQACFEEAARVEAQDDWVVELREHEPPALGVRSRLSGLSRT